MDDSTSVLVAVAEFLMEVNPRLPAFWYSFNENGARSLFFLFGMSITLWPLEFQLKTRGDDVHFHQDRFEKGFNLLVGNMPNGIEASSCKLDDPKERSFTVRNLKR
jgi:hypothetical protein